MSGLRSTVYYLLFGLVSLLALSGCGTLVIPREEYDQSDSSTPKPTSIVVPEIEVFLVTPETETPLDRQTPTRVPEIVLNEVPSEESSTSVEQLRQVVIVVQPGDSLALISERVFGTQTKWPLIYDQNRETISDPRVLTPGTVITITVSFGGGN